MSFLPGHIPVTRGAMIATAPIRGEKLHAIRALLQGRPRDLCIWSLGTGCALRGKDLVNIRWIDLEDDGERISFSVKASKTGKVAHIRLNPVVSADVRAWRRLSNCEYVISGQRGQLTVATLGRLVKGWAAEVGVTKNIASHSLRKSFCRALAETHDVPLYKLMWLLQHGSERQTATYLGIMQSEIEELYELVV